MKRTLRYVVVALLAVSCLCACNREGKVIPRKKFAKIYAEMFLADSWLTTSSSEVRKQADTTAFYAPIFEKYGYTVEDYWASVSYYLQDPDRFSRILKRSGTQLEAHYKALQAKIDEELAVDPSSVMLDKDEPIEQPHQRERLSRRRRNASEEESQVVEEDRQ